VAGKIRAPDEFALIAGLFAPLAAGYSDAYGLTDDVAYLDVSGRDPGGGRLRRGEELVVKTDAIVATVHFLADDPPDLVARKLLRVNLSDLAAKGARPLVYTLAVMLPREVDLGWLERFAAGLRADQDEFGVMLVGGDMNATPGPSAFSLTILGAIPAGQRLLRSAAVVGDAVFMSGTLGDGALGLRALHGEFAELAKDERGYLAGRYRLPLPRLALGRRLRGSIHAAMDISDGLLGDLGHIAKASKAGGLIEVERLPLSPPARKLLERAPALLKTVLTGGDDYELLFTAPPEAEAALAAIGLELDIPVTRVGAIVAGKGVRVLGRGGREIRLSRSGYRHF
jgi:thiamine-monophosphate kinase